MHDDDRHAGRRRTALLACVAAGVVGLLCVGAALAAQRHAPQPAATTATAPLPAPAGPSSATAPATTASSTTEAEPSSPVTSSPAPRVAPISISIPVLHLRAGFVEL